MADAVNLSLDEIIKQNQQNRSGRTRGRGGGNIRGRGGGRGGRRSRGGRGGRGGRGAMIGNQEDGNAMNGRRTRSRSRSRGPRGRSSSRGRPQGRARSQSQSRSQSRTRSRSRQRNRSNSRPRSNSRSRQYRGLTPKGRAGLEDQQFDMPPLTRSNRGGMQTRLRRSNSNPNLQGNVHSRLGINTQRGGLQNRSLAFTKRGISKRGRGLSTRGKFTNVGLRSDQILMEQRNRFRNNNVIRSQTFTRSRNNSFSSGAQFTVSVANDFARKRRNSVGSANFLNRDSLAQLNNENGGYRIRRGPGSAASVGSNKSNRSNRSDRSDLSRRSNQSRGRGRGRNRGIGRKFVNTQVLNPQLQNEIAVIQGKTGRTLRSEKPSGIELNFTPVPSSTQQTLHQRFAHP